MLKRVLEPKVVDEAAEAQVYAAMDHMQVNAAVVERLVKLGAAGRVLDLGTGPGDIPLMLCERLPDVRVIAVDAAASMLAIAQQQIDEAGLSDRITLEQADVKRLPFDACCFDTVFSNTTLHHLAEPMAMLREAARVLKPGGCLMIRDLYRPETEAQLDALVAKHAGDQTPQQQKLLRDSLLAALTPEELRKMAGQLALIDWEVVVDTDRHMTLQTWAVS